MPDSGDVSVVILAGGMGTRLRGLFPGLPKPMVPVAGQPFLHWITAWLAAHGLDHFVYSTGHLSEVIEQWVEAEPIPGLAMTSRREDRPLGTGGGLMNCLDLCRDWVLVANGDSLVTRGVDALLAVRSSGAAAGLLGVEASDTSRFGRLEVDGRSMLREFQEKVPGQGLINGGTYLFRKSDLLDERREGPQSIEYDILPALLDRKLPIAVIDAGSAPFIDIGTPETVAQAEQFVRDHF